jgi:hypothetical protein
MQILNKWRIEIKIQRWYLVAFRQRRLPLAVEGVLRELDRVVQPEFGDGLDGINGIKLSQAKNHNLVNTILKSVRIIFGRPILTFFSQIRTSEYDSDAFQNWIQHSHTKISRKQVTAMAYAVHSEYKFCWANLFASIGVPPPPPTLEVDM